MKLTYHPEGSSEPKVWQFSLGKLRVKETKALEAVTKMPFGTEFRLNLLKGNTTARQAMLWHLLRKDHPGMFARLDDVDFADDEVTLEQGAAEWQQSYDELLKTPKIPNLSDEEREAALEMMLAEIAAAKAAEAGPECLPDAEAAADEPGKDQPAL